MLQDLLAAAVSRDPAAPAVVDDRHRLTYAELDAWSDRVAAALHARGVRAGDRVVVWTGKSAEALAVLQGCLRVGAVYAPVAAANPPPRVGLVAASCAAGLVVTDRHTDVAAGGAADLAAPVVSAEVLLQEGRELPVPAPVVRAEDDAAYILFTSGSTGTPKGVTISSRNALAFVRWAAAEVGLTAQDRLSNHAPLNFDLSVFDVYGALLAGACVHLVPPELAYAPEQLVRFIRDHSITVWYSVPSALSLMLTRGRLLEDGPLPHLRACIFAGEPFALEHAQRLRRAWPGVRLWNWYGPTETNVCTSYEVTDEDLSRTTPLPIGTACSGDEVRLDGDGEIVVSGPTVMLGYWGGPRQSGPYRTGDLGRFDVSGNLEYVGRRDSMVKVRGHRIELGEIEAALSTLPDVHDVVVLVGGSGLEAALHAFLTCVPGSEPSLLSVKRHCAERLPTYMVVDAVHVVPVIPRTGNGKTDRSSLLARLGPAH